MRLRVAIIFSLICSPAMADDPITVTPQPKPPQVQFTTPVSIGRPHVCADAYPLEALERMAEGKVVLAFHIEPDGHVKDPTIEQTSGDSILDTASRACASTWTYKPAMTDGVPVEVPWKVNVIWRIGPPTEPTKPVAPCNQFVAPAYQIPDSITGRTSVVFLVMPDRSIVPKKIVASSGDTALDAAAMLCVAARHYEPANGVVPPIGRALYTVVNWNLELARVK